MKLNEIYNKQNKYECTISFEVFPPKNPEKHYDDLFSELDTLNKYKPSLISLTYGAGGNNNTSIELTKLLNDKYNVMAHFTCICNSRQSVINHIQEIQNLGVDNILALRGDIPLDKTLCEKDFHYADELVEFIKSNSNLSVAVAGYPEGHIEAPDLLTDIKNLQKKVEAGAETIFTQLFFDNSKFFSYIEKLQSLKIDLPVVAGIMPIISCKQIERMTTMAKVTIPSKLLAKIEKFKDNPDDMKKLGIDYASEQCCELIKNKVDGLHFYTLNKSYSTAKILENIL